MPEGRGACQPDVMGIVNTGIFPVFPVANETAGERQNHRTAPLSALVKAMPMIDPPSQQPGHPERKVELDQTADYVVQLLVEEAHLIGWQRVEFLTAIMDAANARLSSIEEETDLGGGGSLVANADDNPAN